MFSPHLFDHKYDIDTVIGALTAAAPAWLETRTGTLSATEPANIDPSHRFPIEPLPASFLQELAASPEQSHLTAAEKAALASLLQTTSLTALPQHFEDGRLGGWLRERVKEAALDWLDTHNLIPPSMRHINRQKAARLYATRNVTIESDD